MACRGPDRLDNDNDFGRSKVDPLGHNTLTFYEIGVSAPSPSRTQ